MTEMGKEPAEAFTRLLHTLLRVSPNTELFVRAVYGFCMREHVDRAHPEDVEKVAELCTTGMEPETREAWLRGYRYCETEGTSDGASGQQAEGHG